MQVQSHTYYHFPSVITTIYLQYLEYTTTHTHNIPGVTFLHTCTQPTNVSHSHYVPSLTPVNTSEHTHMHACTQQLYVTESLYATPGVRCHDKSGYELHCG